LFRKVALLASTTALVAGSLFMGTGAHAGAPPVDATTSTVSCATIQKGVVKFKPPLVSSSTGSDTISVQGVLQGCTTNNGAISSISGQFKGTLNSPTNGFLDLLGPSNATGTITITWKTVPALTVKTSTITISSGDVSGATNQPFGNGANDPAYGQFDISNVTVAGSFAGNDGGASSVTHAMTVEDAGFLATEGFGPGLKSVTLGSGVINLG
jgi:hypothetical protein